MLRLKFIDFIKAESRNPLKKFLTMGAIAGLSNALVVAIINMAAKPDADDTAKTLALLLFVITLVIYVISQKFILHTGDTMVEEIIDRIRVRLSGKILRADLLSVEKIGNAEIFNRLTQETAAISESGRILIMALQSAVLIACISAYLAFISFQAFVILVVLMCLGVIIYRKNTYKIFGRLSEVNGREIELFSALDDILTGMKEVKFSATKRSALSEFILHISSKLKNLKTEVAFKYSENFIFSQSFFFVLLGGIVFVLPKFTELTPDMTLKILTAVLFILAPISNLVTIIPLFDKVNLAIDYIYSLEAKLEQSIDPAEEDNAEVSESFNSFQTIEFDHLTFSYQDAAGNNAFTVGPLDFTVNRGEVVFIVGGNGCGKTTFMKMLTMLYYSQSGNIKIDNKIITKQNATYYRELFSSVFSDFHLFSKLFGVENADKQRVEELLKLMQIDNKTEFLGDRFSNLNLSTGQKKRLALIVSMLEDKPICIFDEWAADQDPEFRKYFYETLLTNLKKQGKTVIAVSHDDRYFGYADRVLKMDYGTISSVTVKKEKAD